MSARVEPCCVAVGSRGSDSQPFTLRVSSPVSKYMCLTLLSKDPNIQPFHVEGQLSHIQIHV